MTTTDTTSLADILAAKKADLVVMPEVIEIEANEHGEIVSVAATEVSPTEGGDSSALPVVAPAPVEVRYPEVPPRVVGGLPYIRDYAKLAKTICQTEMVPDSLKGRYDAITAVFMAGYELGMGPMQSLNSFDMIQGRPSLKPEAMRALIMDKGHLFVLGEGEGYAEVTARRKDWGADFPTQVYRYDLGDAAQAGLAEKPNWRKMPRDMLAARATGGAGRRWFADVIAGMSYTTEEVRDFSGPEQEVTPSPPTPSPTPPSDATPKAADESRGREPQDSTPAITTDPPKRPRGRPRKATTPPKDAPGPAASATSTTAPKRPRGRPRKATTPPKDAPGPAASATSTTAPESEPTTAPSTPPELNSEGDASVTRSMLTALTQIIAGLPQVQQPLCRAFIREHYPEGSADLGQADIQKCIDIAAGWPDSAAQHPIPEADQTIPMF